MSKVRKAKENSNPEIQALIDAVNQERQTKRKIASSISGKSLNIHKQLSHLGGIKVVIQSLNNSIQECVLHVEENQDKETIECLRQLRDILIREHYGWQTWNLIELMLA